MQLLLCALYVFCIGILSHFIGNALPRSWFCAEKAPWRSAGWERDGRIYDAIGIRKWKDKVPDSSKYARDMVPKSIAARPTCESIGRLVAETCVAECVHAALMLASLPVLWIWPGAGGAVVYFLCILGNLPFILIQRFNRPRLLRMQQRMRRLPGES